MLPKKIFSTLLTLTLIVGVGFAIYQSMLKQIAAKKQQESMVAQIGTLKLEIIDKTNKELERKLVYRKTEQQIHNKAEATPPVVILPPKKFFDGKLSHDSTLHVVGVYEGEAKKGEEQPPWWSHCPDQSNPEAMKKCHQKYAGIRYPQVISIKVSYNKSPVVLALMAYEPVIWSLDLYPNVKLQGIILSGYSEQKLIGIPSNIPVIAYTNKTPDCNDCSRGEGYFYAYKRDESLNKAAEKLYEITGKQISSFQGAYKARAFNISNLSN
jgi:hypothetical protein